MKGITKDEGLVIFFIVVPLFYPLVYSWIYTDEVVREVPVAVVDMSHSDMSRKFARMIDASADTKIAGYCNDMIEAKDMIGRQKAYAILYFPSDFQNNPNRMEQSHVSVFCDMSFMLYYKALMQTATAVAGSMNTTIQTERMAGLSKRESEIMTQPLDIEEVEIFNTTGGYGNFIIPGVLMLVIQQTLIFGIGLAAGTRKENMKMKGAIGDTLRQSGAITTVTGRSLAYLMIYAVISAYVLLIVPRLFNFVSMVHGADLLCFILPYLLSCIFFANIIAHFVRRREDIMLIAVFTSVPFLFMSGVSWPQSAIPTFWQWVSSVVPSTFGVRGFIRMNTMGALLDDVSHETMMLWIQAAIYFIVTLVLAARAKKQNQQQQ
ncbi:MAG: ABC transporter permease [Prevotella sp.]